MLVCLALTPEASNSSLSCGKLACGGYVLLHKSNLHPLAFPVVLGTSTCLPTSRHEKSCHATSCLCDSISINQRT